MDKWTTDYRATKDLVTTLRRLLSERSRLTSAGESTTRITTDLQVKLSKLKSEIDSLDDQLDQAAADPRVRLTQRDLSIRRTQLDELLSAHVELVSQLRAPATATVGDSERGAANTPRKTVTWGANTTHSDSMSEHDESGLLLMQHDLLNEQDAELDKLSESVARQREIGIAISDELTQHTALLEQLEHDVDHTTDRMSSTNRMLRRVANARSNRRCKICVCVTITLLLLAVFILLAATKWGCTLVKPSSEC